MGGGIATLNGQWTFELSGLILEYNTADRGGGIFYNGSTEGNVTDSNIWFNTTSSSGAGIYNYGHITLNRVTLSGNNATSTGGGITNAHELKLYNVTLSDNSANNGGGIYNNGGTTVSLDHCSLANNSTIQLGSAYYGEIVSQAYTHNTIFASASSGNTCYLSEPDVITDLGNNLSSDHSCSFTTGANDLIDTDPMVIDLSWNGGVTQTMALQYGSPAIDTADPANTLSKDQRGYFRPVDGDSNGTSIADIGAFEYASFLLDIFSWLPLIMK